MAEKKEEVRYWYPLCGKERGWCLGEGGCRPIGKGGGPAGLGDCVLFLLVHPLTGQKPASSRAVWRRRRKQYWLPIRGSAR